MRRPFLLGLAAVLLSAAPAAAQWHHDEHRHREYEAHWHAVPEHADRLIHLWHERFFGGPPPPAWAGTWVKVFNDGGTPDDVLAYMLSTDEFYNLSGGTNAGYVRNAFTRLVGRPPNEAEFAYWLGRVNFESRLAFAHDLIARYPPPAVEAAPVAVPAVPVAPVYEYRPPIWRYRR